MRISSALSALLSACALFAVGCTGSHPVMASNAAAGAEPGVSAHADAGLYITADGPQAAPVQPPTTLCVQLAGLQCGAEQRCCENPGRDLETCQKAVSDACAQNLFLDDIAAIPSAGFDMQLASAVFLEFAQRLSECDVDVSRWNVGPTGIRSIFRGTIEEGQSCKPAQVLTSSKSTQAAALLSCRDPETTACLPQSLLGDWTCTLKGTTGASCLTDDNCQEDTYCSNPEQSPLGQCQPRSPDGTACTGSTQCTSLTCVSGTCQSPDVDAAYCAASN